jgi:hypothetical protein
MLYEIRGLRVILGKLNKTGIKIGINLGDHIKPHRAIA